MRRLECNHYFFKLALHVITSNKRQGGKADTHTEEKGRAKGVGRATERIGGEEETEKDVSRSHTEKSGTFLCMGRNGCTVNTFTSHSLLQSHERTHVHCLKHQVDEDCYSRPREHLLA